MVIIKSRKTATNKNTSNTSTSTTSINRYGLETGSNNNKQNDKKLLSKQDIAKKVKANKEREARATIIPEEVESEEEEEESSSSESEIEVEEIGQKLPNTNISPIKSYGSKSKSKPIVVPAEEEENSDSNLGDALVVISTQKEKLPSPQKRQPQQQSNHSTKQQQQQSQPTKRTPLKTKVAAQKLVDQKATSSSVKTPQKATASTSKIQSNSKEKGKGKVLTTDDESPVAEEKEDDEEEGEEEEVDESDATPELPELPPQKKLSPPAPHIASDHPPLSKIRVLSKGEVEVEEIGEGREEIGPQHTFSRQRGDRWISDRVWVYHDFFGEGRERIITLLAEGGAHLVDTVEEAHFAIFPRGSGSEYERAIEAARDASCLPIMEVWVRESVIHHKKRSKANRPEERLNPENYSLRIKKKPSGKIKERTPFTKKDKEILVEYLNMFRKEIVKTKKDMYALLEKNHPHHTIQSWENHYKKNIVQMEKLLMAKIHSNRELNGRKSPSNSKGTGKKRARSPSSDFYVSNDDDDDDDGDVVDVDDVDDDDDDEEDEEEERVVADTLTTKKQKLQVKPTSTKKKSSIPTSASASTSTSTSEITIPTPNEPTYYLVHLSQQHSISLPLAFSIHKQASGDRNLATLAIKILGISEENRSREEKGTMEKLWSKEEDEVVLKYSEDRDALGELVGRVEEDVKRRRKWLLKKGIK